MVNPVGEDSWLAYLEEAARNASDLEQRVHVVELYKRAVGAEPGSLRLWLAYCDYFWRLWSSSQSADGGWPEQEQIIGRELFSFGAALDLWQQGYEAIKYRLDDSHLLWDRWLSLEMEQLAKTKTPEGVRRITHLYRDRLATPHLTWDDSSQAFSSFLSEYSTAAWEETMKEATAMAQGAKRAVAARDNLELKLKEASRAGQVDALKSVMQDYLEWEMRQAQGDAEAPEMASELCHGLFERALTGVFSMDDSVWHEYIVFVSSQTEPQASERLLDILRRAVQHCPWSGQLWKRYILCAEEAKLAFSDIESIKHAATSENQLYKNGMESMIEMYVAWCGFLKRTALEATATDEAVDVADVGLRAALEDVAVVGKRLYGKDFLGDPKFRLERIYIQYLTEKKGAVDEARAVWNKLADVDIHADSYDFWFCYYMWEMFIFSSGSQTNRSPTPSSNVSSSLRIPKLATAVLHAAATRKTIDWPERVLEVYLQHCNDYELPTSVRRATDMVHRVDKAVRRRRQREAEDKAAAYAAYYGPGPGEPLDSDPASFNGSKRKRDSQPEPTGDAGDKVNKRQRTSQEAAAAQPPSSTEPNAKRDRENATVIVTGLPADVTQTKVRQYFKEYGHINSLTTLVREKDGQSSTALIEFSSPEEAQSSLLRDGKYFGQSQLSVQSGHDLTVFVTNFPPEADDKYIRHLFKDCGEMLSIRWPSLKVNTHRRFCYVSFRDRGAAAKAVAKEGTVLNGKFSLLAKYSDPSRKKSREGAVAEGREVHVAGIDRSATEDELRGVFSKLGAVSRVNMPLNMVGKNRGFAFVAFETKEQAQRAAAEMNKTKLRNQILSVEISEQSKVKHAAKTVASDHGPARPSEPGQGEAEEKTGGEGGGNEGPKPSAADIADRTIALMGLPDTVNDTRIRALVEPLGTVVKLVLQPGHGGAKLEFADAAAAGRAALQLDGMQFEGAKLRTGTVEELRRARAERSDDRIVYGGGGREKRAAKGQAPARPAALMAPPPPVRRPGLGPRRGLGFAPRPREPAKPAENGKAASKTNADFRAMVLGGGGGGKEEEKEEGKEEGKKEAELSEAGDATAGEGGA